MAVSTKLLFPGDGAVNPYTVPGTTRTYTCAAGASVLVPEFDAILMQNSGWVNSCGERGAAGVTASRPASPYVNQVYNDTQAGYLVVYGGKVTGWLRCTNGASG
jgi:hypothetical protein